MKASSDQYLLPLRRSKDLDEPVSENPPDVFLKREDGPTVFGEEIEDKVPCCVLSLEANAIPPSESQVVRIASGQHVLKEFRRTMQFDLMMNCAEDAARTQSSIASRRM